MDVAAHRLRMRSAHLRALADRLDDAPAAALAVAVGADTWRGPVADQLAAQARRFRSRLIDAAGDLRWQAQLLEERAAALDSAATP
jgi:hypothetical protein